MKDTLPHSLRISIFKDLSETEIENVLNYAKQQSHAQGDFLFYEKMPPMRLFILIKGTVRLARGIGDELSPLTDVGVGSILSERILNETEIPHTLTAEVLTPVVALEFSRDNLGRFERENPALYAKFKEAITGSVSLKPTKENLSYSQPVAFRVEKDLLGKRKVPASALYGIQTLRGLENFPITGSTLSSYPNLIRGLALVKKACALANHDLGLLDEERCRLISTACDEILDGKHYEHFVVDMMQGGAGTSTNMNANEVIANRALELAGRERGDYDYLHPNNHVNLSQSTNDVYPTAFRIGLRFALKRLLFAVRELADSFENKGSEFADVIKMGRTQLQDAVPMTLGQEFTAFSVTLREDIQRLQEAEKLLEEINMGATAIGTGISTVPGYAEKVRFHLESISGLTILTAPNLFEATQDTGALVQLSGTLKRTATKLSKICNDLRLLSSGPRAGLGEINLPALQPGSSIMPGKVNPVGPEVVNQVAFEVIGNDVTITIAAEAGQLQLNVMEPVIVWSLLKSINHLRQACIVLKERTVDGITANKDVCRRYVDNSIGVITALLPIIGYANATELAKEALHSSKSVRELVLEKGLMTEEQVNHFLDPRNMFAR
ncbi:MAG: aspartate ammonia-lyase [Puniceicoccales bacterium]|jgi:aspartate ammonia-lyase|nr:aspartate ammonia-lyase [Puniceicoccales bacterium]